MEGNILVFCAHSDDEVIGMGGTISKYSAEGKKVITVIFSSGGKSSPWLKSDLVVKERIKESQKIGKFIGSSKTIFLGLEDMKLSEDIEKKHIKKEIIKLIKEYTPEKIFTHSAYDPHVDHRPVNKVVVEALEETKKDIPLFAFEVWNIVDETHPKIYMDVSKTFHKKIEAMKKFKSQRLYVYILLIPVYLRAIAIGILHGYKFGERFYKIK